jgi:hypothetical protein
MAALKERENHIPLHKDELAEALIAGSDLTAEERDGFRAYCRLVSLIFHLEYYQRLEKLKAAYAPFDPDTNARPLFQLNADERLQRQNTLFNDVALLLEEANYRHLSRDEIVATLKRASAWGLCMDVDFHLFERLAILVRGESTEKRSLRRLRKALLREQLDVPIYQRVVMLLKMRPHRRAPRKVDTEHVYLQLFRNIPQLDITMLLPGARARLNWLDRGRIIVPIFGGLALTAFQIARDLRAEVTHFIRDFMALQSAAVWAAASAALGYGIKSYYNYYQMRQSYNLSLTQVLYYQNLDTNAGVLYRLLDEAEEQDCREAMLGYFFLWRTAGEDGWTSAQLQEHVEKVLHNLASLDFRFDTRDCLPRLERYHLVEKLDGHYRAVPLQRALETLEHTWNKILSPGRTVTLPTPVPTQADHGVTTGRT